MARNAGLAVVLITRHARLTHRDRTPASELVDAGWARALQPVADQVAAMGEFLRTELAAGRGYLPAGQNVLRAFTFPFDDVRVLIVGQDPYPDAGARGGAELLGGARRAAAAAQPGQHLHASTPPTSGYPGADQRRPDAVGAAGRDAA